METTYKNMQALYGEEIPKQMQKLLESCKSDKVKRICLYFGDRMGIEWYRKLQLNKIDIGVGVRIIYPNGSYVSKYKITIDTAVVHNEYLWRT